MGAAQRFSSLNPVPQESQSVQEQVSSIQTSVNSVSHKLRLLQGVNIGGEKKVGVT
jgi:hypothetical protein